MSRLRVALCQLDSTVGDFAGNVTNVLDALAAAEAAGADLAVFPELVVCGYPPEDLLLEPAFVAANSAALDEIASRSGRCAAVVGFVDSGRDLYNAAAVCAGGKVHGIWHKELLPNYGVFDERRWFVPGRGDTPLFVIGGVRVAVTICEDAWSPTGPIARQAAGGAELVVSLNASPYRAGVLVEREQMLATRAADASVPLVYVNLVGGQDELVFDGASMIFDADGEVVAAAGQFDEEVTVADLEVRPAYRQRILDPRGRPQADPLPSVTVSEAPASPPTDHRPPRRTSRLAPVAEVFAALVRATRDYIEKNGFREVVVGLSGGIDSSLVALIAVEALGPERVHGVAMPSRFSSPESLEDAKALAVSLGIDFRAIGIEAARAAFLDLLQPSFGRRPVDLAEENLQARVRGTLLMGLSNKLGWLVLTTGNKSETAVGYSTLYGDTAGGFAVIRDVPKTLVYAICRYANEVAGTDRIPLRVLEKPPSAELRADQRDDDSLPPYDELDPIIEAYVEHDASLEELVEAGHDRAVAARVLDLIDAAEYKRRQAPPGPRVTSRAFGKDRRMPITNRFRASRSR